MLLVRLKSLGPAGVASAVLVSLEGEVRDGDSAVLDSCLTAARTGGGDVVVDVGAVTYLSEPAAHVIERFARLQAAESRRVVVAGASPGLRATLAGTAAGSSLRYAASLARAVADARRLAAPGGLDGAKRFGASGVCAPRTETAPVCGPRSMALIHRAQQILVRRYGLDGPRAALSLMRAASSLHHDLAIVPLAAAVLSTPAPDLGAWQWFPGHRGEEAPPLPFAPTLDASSAKHSETVAAVRDTACRLAQTDMGNVQLTAHDGAALRLQAHRGFSTEFTDHFAWVSDDTSACGRALLDGTRVIISEVATDPVFDDTARRVMLSAGIRSVQSTPLRGSSGRPMGMLSTHYPLSRRVHSTSELRALDELATQAGMWLEWHERAVLISALEHLHRIALHRTDLRVDSGGNRTATSPA